MASFSVIVLMKESAAVIMRFAEYYHKIGAAQILVYNDGPLENALTDGLDMDRLAACRVTLIACDDAYWSATPTGRRLEDIQDRQRVIYLEGQPRCTTDWALICDADEFVIDRIPVSKFLDAIPDDVDSVAIDPAEAVWGPARISMRLSGPHGFVGPMSTRPNLRKSGNCAVCGSMGRWVSCFAAAF